MGLPHPTLANPAFSFASSADLRRALEGLCEQDELAAIGRLLDSGLPPVTSRLVLSVMLGVNPGLVWSLQKRTERYYREFRLKKGKGVRVIQAPRVALKAIQKWLSVTLAAQMNPPSHVYGFVPGRSHIHAALCHMGAEWIFSVDIRNFFPSTPSGLVKKTFEALGYPANGSSLLASLSCFRGYLAQGSPLSPVVSNLCFSDTDASLLQLSRQLSCTLTRYADDIVFSGTGYPPVDLPASIEAILAPTPWRVAQEKTQWQHRPSRLKVHGILVDGDKPRLTKGYRNKLRAFDYILNSKDISESDRARLSGHVSYRNHADKLFQDLLHGRA